MSVTLRKQQATLTYGVSQSQINTASFREADRRWPNQESFGCRNLFIWSTLSRHQKWRTNDIQVFSTSGQCQCNCVYEIVDLGLAAEQILVLIVYVAVIDQRDLYQYRDSVLTAWLEQFRKPGRHVRSEG